MKPITRPPTKRQTEALRRHVKLCLKHREIAWDGHELSRRGLVRRGLLDVVRVERHHDYVRLSGGRGWKRRPYVDVIVRPTKAGLRLALPTRSDSEIAEIARRLSR
jgi:hypothetical protein